MTDIFVTEDTSTAIAGRRNDEIFVMPGVNVTNVITNTDDDDFGLAVHIYGAVVFGLNDTIVLGGVDESRDDLGRNLVTVGKDGLVRGEFGAILMQGRSNELANFGQITSKLESIVINGDGAEVSNAGVIYGAVLLGNVSNAIGRGDINTVRNTGYMEGSTAVRSTDYPLHLENDGHMAGTVTIAVAIVGSDGESYIRNSGVITASRQSLFVGGDGEGPVTVVNSGQMFGDVQFDGGDDLYRAVADGVVVGRILGNEGADRLLGGGLDDLIYGGPGDDVLRGRGEEDSLYGGSGEDHLRGDAAEDALYGGAENDRLGGGLDDDALFGEEGADDLRGGRGDDALEGGAGDDQLRGGRGDDTLAGGAGTDQLRGGEGSDVFVWTAEALDGVDRVWGFKRGEGDRMDFTGASADGGVRVVDRFAAGDGFEGIEIRAARGRLRIDADDDGTVDHVIRVVTLDGEAMRLTGDDFLV